MGAKKRFTGDSRRMALVALSCVLAMSVGGCSSRPGGGGENEERTPAGVASDDLHLPIETYLFSNAEMARLEEAKFVLIGECLRRLKLDHTLAAPGTAPGPRSLTERRYGITDGREAKADGYRLSAVGAERPRSLAAQMKSLAAPQRAQLMAALQGEAASGADQGAVHKGGLRMNGVQVPAGGCAGEATEAISGGSGQLGPSQVARSANFSSFDDSRSDPRVGRVLGAWSACMKDKGYAYPDPLTAMSDPGFRGTSPTPKELGTAQADVECKQKTDLVEIWFGVEAALQKDMIAQKGRDFEAALTSKKSQMRRAESALESR
ncbi:hypothetical protein [Streptomyces sp. NPDC058193]|uniref:hypothetical protein n=1 Tax=Streptomyces sp. NPDC058193 TaxID=3346373 RepID=UPI0036E0D9F5